MADEFDDPNFIEDDTGDEDELPDSDIGDEDDGF